jgi:hypothetical protein
VSQLGVELRRAQPEEGAGGELGGREQRQTRAEVGHLLGGALAPALGHVRAREPRAQAVHADALPSRLQPSRLHPGVGVQSQLGHRVIRPHLRPPVPRLRPRAVLHLRQEPRNHALDRRLRQPVLVQEQGPQGRVPHFLHMSNKHLTCYFLLNQAAHFLMTPGFQKPFGLWFKTQNLNFTNENRLTERFSGWSVQFF